MCKEAAYAPPSMALLGAKRAICPIVFAGKAKVPVCRLLGRLTFIVADNSPEQGGSGNLTPSGTAPPLLIVIVRAPTYR
jgi:hypothetical protein